MSTVDIQYKLIIIKLFWIIFNKDVIPDCACIIFICVNVIEWARFGDACSKFNDKAIFRLYAIKNHVAWTIHRRLFLVQNVWINSRGFFVEFQSILLSIKIYLFWWLWFIYPFSSFSSNYNKENFLNVYCKQYIIFTLSHNFVFVILVCRRDFVSVWWTLMSWFCRF